MNNFDELTNSDTWTMVDFLVNQHDAEIVADTLWGLGVVAIEERDHSSNTVTLRTSMGENPEHSIRAVVTKYPGVKYQTVQVDRAVADTWREFAEPTWVNDDVALVPAWVTAPKDCIPIYVEPLDTFGLGNHPTTLLALELALTHVDVASHVFDLGSGSGVLAVALAKLRNCSVQAYDIAESSRDALAANAARNGVTTCSWSDGYPNITVDAVLANILAPVLIQESSEISSAVKNGGLVILSGMRTEQVAKVCEAFPVFTEQDRSERDGWTAVVLRKES